MLTSFQYPPKELDTWVRLGPASRNDWLIRCKNRFFSGEPRFSPSREPNRIITLRSGLVDSLLGFYCALGEAVNGPGGYFGLSMQALHDCLIGGFGLEHPFLIVWEGSGQARDVLDADAVLNYLEDECPLPFPEGFEEGLAWRADLKAAAERQERTMFEEILSNFRTTPGNRGEPATLVLR